MLHSTNIVIQNKNIYLFYLFILLWYIFETHFQKPTGIYRLVTPKLNLLPPIPPKQYKFL